MNIFDDYRQQLKEFELEGRLREIPSHRLGALHYDLTLNDYMGLAAKAPEWREEFRKRFGDAAMTASASRLLASDQARFSQLEDYLEKAYSAQIDTEEERRRAILFNSGYHANVGVVQALDLPGTLWATDKLIHASLIDGLRLANAECRRWRHNDTAALRKILEKGSETHNRIIVCCESIYSMDGDVAPLVELVALKREFPKMMLYVDEAHALGCFGMEGLGKCCELGILKDIDILIGTFGKACASVGAFVMTTPLIRDFLVNCARSLIFSTSIAPANAAWTLFMLEKIKYMDKERHNLSQISEEFRKGIEKITGIPNPSRSAIVPLVTGSAEKAIRISRQLHAEGISALPIRRPTVPPGGERIRFSLHADMTMDDIRRILTIIKDIYED